MHASDGIVYKYPWLFPAIIFFLLFAPNLLREGMFVDGVWYAAISNNLAHGTGSFWAPSFTQTIYPVFHEHPPLAFWLQSLFFRLLGEHFLIERLYCLVVFLISAWVIHLIWKQLFSEKPEFALLSFLPVSIWMLNTEVFFAYPNNLLECTMTLFLLLALHQLIKSTFPSGQGHRLAHILTAGILVVLAFLTKGFAALFPLAFFLLHGMVFREKLSQTVLRSAILGATIAMALFLVFLIPEARAFLSNYLDEQVLAALKGQRTENLRDHRSFLALRLLNSFAIVAAVCLGLYLLSLRSGRGTGKSIPADKTLRWPLFFFLLGLSASLPLLISIKQAGYYLLPSVPLFSIAIGILLAPTTSRLIPAIGHPGKKRVYLILGGLLLAIAMAQAAASIGTTDKRDRVRVGLVKQVGALVPRGEVISSGLNTYDPSLHGFFQRYHMIALDTVLANRQRHRFLLSDNPQLEDPRFHLVKRMDGFTLYKRMNE